MNSGEINSLTPPPAESKGSLVGSVIVILILVAGAIYLFSRPATAPVAPPNIAPEELMATTTTDSDDIETLSTEATLADPLNLQSEFGL